ncbi:MAG: membrane-bound lytic murein transglycosylase D [Saprospiraceae bacterium]|jgi:membrane-bound lytic murein transglycosylase D
MNRIYHTALQCKVILLALFIGLSASFGAFGNVTAETHKTIEDRILSHGSSVEIQYSSEVKKRINQYIKHQRAMSEVLIGRSKIYFPGFEQILREKGLPTDLKYLSVIESGLKPSATSRSGAAGLWQFMRPTGKMMGLKISRTVDERRDVEKSTMAAAEYLLKLYNQFDDWTLAIAAYNCGPGNMRKAIRKSGGKKSFWEVMKYLPKETREYVPKFIAMTYMMNYYYEHDLMPAIPNQDLINTSTAKVYESLNLNKLSKELDIELTTMRTLNPSFIRNYIPKSENGIYNLVLPTPEMRIVARKYNVLASLPRLEEKETKDMAIVNLARPSIEIINIPHAQYITKDMGGQPSKVKSMYAHTVALGRKRDKRHSVKPDAYKMDNRKYTIASFVDIVKSSRKSL